MRRRSCAALEIMSILLDGVQRDRPLHGADDSHESLQVEAIQSAVSLLATASAQLDPAGVDPKQWQELLWRESHLPAVLVWSTRRTRLDA